VKLRAIAFAGWAIASALPACAQTPAEEAAAREAFARAVAVFQHPRCTNCHNRGEGPRQGNTPRAHQLNVKRGPEGRGVGAQACTACHKAQNTAGGAIPGAPDWRMPPPGRAGWDGLTPAEICAALKDPARNAGLRPDQVVEHMAQDKLVLWAWAAGGIRSAPPLAHAEFMALMRTWNAGGAPCPN
jgi:mono/diheme cytochrome c family protein